MIKYFKELLTALKAIEKHLSKIAGCVEDNKNTMRIHTPTIATKSYIDKY